MPRSSERKTKKPDSRLPRWTWAVIAAGGLLTYVAVGQLLHGHRFPSDLEDLWRSPAAFLSSGAEIVAPYVLLLIPAVLGGLGTRDTLRLIFRGIRKGAAPLAIAKDVALYMLGAAILVLVALFSSSKRR